jgi:hypothetical protein
MRATGHTEGIQSIPEPTLRRLPVYYQYLKNHMGQETYVSGTQIAEALNQNPIWRSPAPSASPAWGILWRN